MIRCGSRNCGSRSMRPDRDEAWRQRRCTRGFSRFGDGTVPRRTFSLSDTAARASAFADRLISEIEPS